MDGNLATTYTLIHAFLTKQLHTKAAQAVKKAAKEVVVLRDDIKLEGPQLDEIIKQWKSDSQKKESSDSDSEDSSSDSDSSSSSSSSTSAKKAKPKGKKEKASKSASSSPSSASSSSSSDDSDSDSAGHAQEVTVVKNVKKLPTPTKKSPLAKGPSPSSSSSSSSSTSGSDSDDESSDVGSSKPKKKKLINKKNADAKRTKTNVTPPERDSSQTLASPNSSADDSSSDSDSSAQSTPQKKAKSIKAAIESKKDSSDSSSSSSSSDSDSKKGLKKPRTKKASKSTSSSSPGGSSSSSESHSNAKMAKNNTVLMPTKDQVMEQSLPTKKRRTGMDGSAVVTATEVAPSSLAHKGGNRKAPVNERFKRVDPDKVEPIADNRYVAKIAPQNDYGKRAHEDLIVTRGAGFRKEKNKKKKGSYRGGEITMESHSFKFT